MEPIHILITERFTQAHLARLRAISPRLNVIHKAVPEGKERDDIAPLFDGTEEVLYCLRPPQNLAVAPNLKWIQLHTAGINLLSDHPLRHSPIRVTNASGTHAVPIGEFAIGMMLALARKLALAVRKQDRAEWSPNKWHLYLGTELRGKTLGVVGYGSIGREAARIAKQGFGMRVLACSRSGNRIDRGYCEPGVGDPDGVLPDAWFTRDQLLELLAQADFVLLAAPLTNETRHLLGETELRAMKPSAFIINIARGDILDEPALIHALQEHWIAGAGLDVFAQEPLPADNALWQLDNAILAPHISSATPHYDDRAVALFAENLRRYINGEALLNLVDLAKGY